MPRPVNNATLGDEFKCLSFLLIDALIVAWEPNFSILIEMLESRQYEQENNQ